MLGIVANKQSKNEKGVKYIYIGKLTDDSRQYIGHFRFAIEQDDDLQKRDFNNLSGFEGNFTIRTKSALEFIPECRVVFRGTEYSIITVDGNRKIDGEQSQSRFGENGNITKFITLRRLGI